VAKSALIIGGGTGIGFATAERLVRRGLAVAIAGRREHVLDEARSRLEAIDGGPEIHTFVGDAGNEGDAKRIVQLADERLGGIELCVNCAGIYEPVHFLELDQGAWSRTLSATLDAVTYPSVAVAAVMAQRNGGRFVLISSISAPLSEPDSAHYSAAKAGVSSLARSMAIDLARHKIRVNAVAPGWIHTEMVDDFVQQATPETLAQINMLGRVGQPDEVANVIEYLGLDAPDFVTGTTMFVDGGQTAMATLI
jgi:NAD(P)-dependent dehydrogenase (short-subunit alcohol dehydrogenase family)